MASQKRLYKSSDPMITGVCGGVAEYFSIDATLVRILAVVLTLVGVGLPLLLYIVGVILIPHNPAEKSGYIDAKAEQATGSSGTAKPAGSTSAAASARSTTSSATSGGWTSAAGPAGPAGAAGSGGWTSAAGLAEAASAATSAGAAEPAGPAGMATPAGAAKQAGSTSTADSSGTAKSDTRFKVSNVAQRARSHWSFAVVAGVFLICIGLFILLGNLVNISIWRFWPVLFVVVGIVQLFTPSSKGWSLERAGGAFVFISVGIVLLAWTLQIISARTFFLCLINLWPALLVCGGLYIIGGARRMSAFNLIGSLLLSATLLLGAWYYGVTNGEISIRMPNGNMLTLTIPASPLGSFLPDAELTEVESLDLGTRLEASLQLHGGGMSTSLNAGEGSSLVVKNATGNATGVELGFDNTRRDSVILNLSKLTSGFVLTTTLPSDIVWNEIAIEAGASELRLDFTELKVRALSVNTGMSSCTVQLGAALSGGSRCDIDAGMAVVKIEVPQDSAVLIYASGLSALDIDQRFFTYNTQLGAWCSKAYSSVFGNRLVTDGKVWTIRQSGVTSLQVNAVGN